MIKHFLWKKAKRTTKITLYSCLVLLNILLNAARPDSSRLEGRLFSCGIDWINEAEYGWTTDVADDIMNRCAAHLKQFLFLDRMQNSWLNEWNILESIFFVIRNDKGSEEFYCGYIEEIKSKGCVLNTLCTKKNNINVLCHSKFILVETNIKGDGKFPYTFIFISFCVLSNIYVYEMSRKGMGK